MVNELDIPKTHALDAACVFSEKMIRKWLDDFLVRHSEYGFPKSVVVAVG